MLKRIFKVLAVVILLVLVAAALPMRTVGSNEMAYTSRPDLMAHRDP